MVFGDFMAWLDAHLANYVSAQTAQAATALSPAAGTLASIYVMGWGYLHLSGQITEPLLDGLKRILTLAVVLGVALHLWVYNDVLVALLVEGPQQLAAVMVGAPNVIGLVDTIWDRGGAAGNALWLRGGVFDGDAGFYFIGAGVWLVIGVLCLYATFLIALAKIATALLLAVGPAFVLAALFERSRALFEAWTGQLITYSLISVLVALVASLLLQIVVSYADQTAARGAELQTVDVLDLLLVSGIVLLLMRQVMPIAAGLGRGVSLSTFGAFSQAARRLSGAAPGAAAWVAETAYTADESGSEVSTGQALPVRLWGTARD